MSLTVPTKGCGWMGLAVAHQRLRRRRTIHLTGRMMAEEGGPHAALAFIPVHTVILGGTSRVSEVRW